MNFITRKHLSRRAMLRGASAAVALPFLDAMHPALSQERLTAAAPVRRFGVVYYTLGAMPERWRPSGEGANFKMNIATQPLDKHKAKLLFLAGLSADPDRSKPDFHDRAIASWLTGKELTRGRIDVGISVDQVAAAHLGKETQFSSIELGTENPSADGSPFFKDAHTNLPVEVNPRLVFERLFGDSDKIDPVAIAARNQADESTLDAVTDQIAGLQSRLGAADRIKLDQYLSSIRDVERRIQIAEKTKVTDLPAVSRPAGVPDSWQDHVKMMFDLQVLAYQADLTRVCNFMLAREASLMTFPHLGIAMQHHEASHHNYEQEKLDNLHKINLNQSELFAYYLDKLDGVKEANGTLLDNSIIFFGSNISNPTVHSQRDLPVMLAGGASGRLNTGRIITYPGDMTPLSNMHLTILDKLGVPTDKLGDSTGTLKLDRLSV